MRQLVWAAILIAGLFGVISGMQVTGVGQHDAFVGPDPSVIPKDAVRLRIIANSNSPQDQNIKRAIRDQVIALIGKSVASARTPAQAHAIIQSEVPRVERLAVSALTQAGMPYGASTTFGPAPFPTKIYGNRVYPAGVYTALRVTLGRGAGQNWWCVLFPPLCFVALTDGDAVAATQAFPDYPPLAVTHVTGPGGKRIPVQLRLAVVDYGEEAIKVFTADFAGLWRKMTTIL